MLDRNAAMNALVLKLLAQRVALALLSLLAVSAIVFAVTAVLPGDAAQEQLGQDATPEALAALRAQMGLNVPAPQRYLRWLGGMLRGDLGTSATTQLSVAELIGSRLPNSLLLAGVTALFSVPIALALGIASAVWRGSWFDRAASTGAVAVVSVPEFLVATLAVLIFAVKLHWLPALSYVSDIESLGQMLRAFAMPVLTLCCVIIAQMMRMSRAAVIDQLEAPYIEMVRLKGASPLRMVLAHALPNAVGPIANAVALSLSYLLGGVIIVETIFNYPGVAKLMVDGVSQRDMPLVQACAMLFCVGYLILVTTADLFGIVANPRLRK
jgi:peptide/nickel transport system permease protein